MLRLPPEFVHVHDVIVSTRRGWANSHHISLFSSSLFSELINFKMPSKQRMRLASKKHSQNVNLRGNVPKSMVRLNIS